MTKKLLSKIESIANKSKEERGKYEDILDLYIPYTWTLFRYKLRDAINVESMWIYNDEEDKVKDLEKLLGKKLPWADFYGK